MAFCRAKTTCRLDREQIAQWAVSQQATEPFSKLFLSHRENFKKIRLKTFA